MSSRRSCHRQIVVDRPDVAGREAILRVHARGARAIDAACRSTLAAALDRAASILARRRSDLSLTAKKLVERETLAREELDLLLQQKAAS